MGESTFWRKPWSRLSNNSTSISIGPSAVYQVNDKLSTGLGINFGYANFRNTDAKQTNYGARLITLYNATRQLQLSGELEQNFVRNSTDFAGQTIKTNFNFPALY